MDEWEYKIVPLTGGSLFDDGGGELTERRLDEFGERGWELATSVTGARRSLGGGPTSETRTLVFKRPKR